jgi:hypothetical protein
MIEQFLELGRCQPGFAHLQIRYGPNITGKKVVETIGKGQVILQRGPQDFEGSSGIVLISYAFFSSAVAKSSSPSETCRAIAGATFTSCFQLPASYSLHGGMTFQSA